jgi:hypothetical protein
MLETKRENELIAERVNELRASLTRTELIERLLGELRELHKTHPWRARADQLRDLYQQTVLPWRPELEDRLVIRTFIPKSRSRASATAPRTDR